MYFILYTVYFILYIILYYAMLYYTILYYTILLGKSPIGNEPCILLRYALRHLAFPRSGLAFPSYLSGSDV